MPRTPASAFACSECGWTGAKWFGRCPECQVWGSVDERGATVRAVAVASVPEDRVARPITAIDTAQSPRRQTGIDEFDRVLGGGLVPGATVLVSGEPGVGKSTLLLDVASHAALRGTRVLYVSAEESAQQVRLRAERTGALDERLFLAAETDLGTVLGQIDAVSPGLLIVDSVQTVAAALLDSQPGQPAQVREVAGTLIRVAKDRGIPLLLVGHVTKDGSIAGPRMLEHLVDVVCSFEGDRQTALRFVRALKNRFGPTDEVGCFEMTGDGIAEVPDPSGLFLSRATVPVSGTCVTIAVEGRRAIPVELQALVVPNNGPNPRRVVSGVDAARVAMLLAVLERRCGLKLAQQDVYVSTVGGIRISEPGADLAIALALASAVRDEALPHDLAAVGEISLAGEIRPVSAARQRIAEGRRLGYSTVLDSECGSLSSAAARAFAAASADTRERVPAF